MFYWFRGAFRETGLKRMESFLKNNSLEKFNQLNFCCIDNLNPYLELI